MSQDSKEQSPWLGYGEQPRPITMEEEHAGPWEPVPWQALFQAAAAGSVVTSLVIAGIIAFMRRLG